MKNGITNGAFQIVLFRIPSFPNMRLPLPLGIVKFQNCHHTSLDSKLALHSRASKILIRNQSLLMGPLQGQRAMLGGPEFVFWEILANGGGQKKSKN